MNLLKTISETLKQSKIETHLLSAKDTGLKIDVLTTLLSKDYKARDQVLSFTFYPTEEDTVKGRYLQLFCELPIKFSEKTQTVFILLVSYLNPKIALGHIGFNYSKSTAYFKYTVIIDENDAKNKDKLKEVIEMINYTLDIFQPTFKLIEDGVQNIEKIIKLAGNFVVNIMLLLEIALLVKLGSGLTGLFWFYLFPLLSFFILGRKNGLIYVVLLIVIAIVFMKFISVESLTSYPADILGRFVATYLFTATLAYVFEVIREKTYTAFIKADNKKSEYLNQVLSQKEEIIVQADLLQETNLELEKLSLVASKTNNAIIIMDSKGAFEWVNEAFVRIYGIDIDELKKRGKTILEASNSKQISKIIQKCLTEKKSYSYENHAIKPDGNKIWVKTTLSPVLGMQNNIEKLIAIDTNITEIKLAEQKVLQKSEEILAQNEKINAQREELEIQNQQITSKSLQITGSITYARTIQNAILPSNSSLNECFNLFIINRPKDIVSGDFYWFSKVKNQANLPDLANLTAFIAVVDCTGHGVPGAFMSMIGSRLLNEIINENKIYSTEKILTELNQRVIVSLRQKETDNKDGMDICLCKIQKTNNSEFNVSFSGDKSNLVFYKDNKIQRLRGDRKSIGGISRKKIVNYTKKELTFSTNDMLYLFSDGIIDQNNYERKRFGTKNMLNFLQENATKSLQEQKTVVENSLDNWQLKEDQRDDILMIGIKL